jgi:hypothetical protein
MNKREISFEKEDAFKTLESVNGWINNMDTKASILLAYLAVIIGFVVSNGLPDLFTQPAPITFCYIIKVVFVVIMYLSLLSSIVLFLGTLTARIKGNNEKHSLLFFGEIAKNSLNDYKSKILNRTEEELIKDVLEQVYINSKICTIKSKYYNIGVKLTLISTVVYIICMILNVL